MVRKLLGMEWEARRKMQWGLAVMVAGKRKEENEVSGPCDQRQWKGEGEDVR